MFGIIFWGNFNQFMNFRFKFRLYAVFRAHWTIFVKTMYLNKREFLLGPLWWDRVKVYRRICSSFFFMSSFCNWLRAHAIFCQPGVVALAGSLSCFFLKPSKLAQQTLRMV